MKKNILRIIIIFLIIIFIFQKFPAEKDKINTLLNKFGPIGSSILFIFLYVLSNFFITGDPKEILKIISALFFGGFLSSILIYIAEIINAGLFFYLSRFLGRDFSQKYLKGRFKSIYEKIAKLNFFWIGVARLSVVIPYRVSDICFGLSNISFRRYIFAVLVFSFPRIYFFQFLISAVGDFSLSKFNIYFQENLHITFLFFIYSIFSLCASILLIFKLSKK